MAKGKLHFPFHQFCCMCTNHDWTTGGAGFTFHRQGKMEDSHGIFLQHHPTEGTEQTLPKPHTTVAGGIIFSLHGRSRSSW